MKHDPWYFKSSSVVVAFILVGPLALPMVWFHPRYSLTKKTVITIVTVILTYFTVLYMAQSIKNILAYYQQASQSV